MSDQSSRRFPIVATVSVLVNILLIGLILGFVLGGGPQSPPPGPGANATLGTEEALARSLVQSMPREDRREMVRVFTQSIVSNQTAIEQRRSARAALRESLLLDPYDEAEVRAALAELSAADAALQAGLQDALASRLGTLSYDQRLVLAGAMARQDERQRAWERRRRMRDERRSD